MRHGRAARKRPKGTQSERSLSARVSNPAIHPPTARGITPFNSRRALPPLLLQPAVLLCAHPSANAAARPFLAFPLRERRAAGPHGLFLGPHLVPLSPP